MSPIIFFVLCSIPLVAAAILLVAQERRYKVYMQSLRQAYSTYVETLLALKTNPASVDLRQQALQAGRRYTEMTHHQRGILRRNISAYSDRAVMQDIDTVTMPLTPLTLEEQLADLEALHAAGVIDAQELALRRKKTLESA